MSEAQAATLLIELHDIHIVINVLLGVVSVAVFCWIVALGVFGGSR